MINGIEPRRRSARTVVLRSSPGLQSEVELLTTQMSKYGAVNDHQRRVTASLLVTLARYDDGRATVADVQAAASTAAGALDNSNGELKAALERVDADLEEIQFTVPVHHQHAAVEGVVEDLRRVLTLDRRQPYCDWCYSPMTESARERSEGLGLDREYSWACDRCLLSKRYTEPPDGWDGPHDEWPFHDA